MINKQKLSASAAALALLVAGGASSVQAADAIEEPGCTLSGSGAIGYMFDWQDVKFDIDDFEELSDGEVDWNTPFGEAGGLVTCGGFNIQADFAYYDHSSELDIDLGGGGGQLFDDKDIDAANAHFGGAAFWRDPSFAAVGLTGSYLEQDILGKDAEYYRIGVFGEFYMEQFTLGASAHYFTGDVFGDFVDSDGYELAAWGRFYATPDLALTLRGDFMWSDVDIEVDGFGGPGGIDETADYDGWAITGEVEYLVWDQGLSVFAGARYAEREFDLNVDFGGGDDADFGVDIDDTQVYAGLKFYFGHDGTLQDRQRTGLADNTSTFKEKLPNGLTSGVLGFVDAIQDAPIAP